MLPKIEALDTDLYELTMAQGYYQTGKANQEVTFDLFFRRIPFNGGYCIFAGLEHIIEYIQNLHFTKKDIEYLKSIGFDNKFLNYLYNDWHFTADIYAMPEGTIVFPDEPIIRVSGPIISTQLIETALLYIVNYQTTVATKASRICLAAQGDPVIEFSPRRDPTGASILTARSAFIGGAMGTSNIKAGKETGIKVMGTMAHSWVQSFCNEFEAFKAYTKSFPNSCFLLLDTYDVLNSGVPNAIRIAKEILKDQNKFLGGRLDSGDLNYLSQKAYTKFTKAGLNNIILMASNELDEFIIEDLKRQGAKINMWGVGTKLGFPNETLGGIYKLVAAEMNEVMEPVIKISNNPEKTTIPGIKTVYRFFDKNKKMLADVMFLADEEIEFNEDISFKHKDFSHKQSYIPANSTFMDLLKPIFDRNVGLVYKPPTLLEIQDYVKRHMKHLPDEYKRFLNPHIYRVGLSEKLFDLRQKLIQEKSKSLKEE